MGTDAVQSRHWYVVHSKPRKEAQAAENLIRQGYATYLPRIKQQKHRRGRWQSVIEPLFPRYLFVHLTEGVDNFTPIRSTLGVTDLVRFGGVVKAVPDTLIAAIQAREDAEQGLHLLDKPWQPGDEVEITDGAFAGLKGIFQAESSEERVIILLRLLGQDNRIRVKRDALIPA